MTTTIRPAEPRDVEALLAIYNWAVANTTATMDDAPRALEQQSAWLTAHNGDPYPALVAEIVDQGRVVGYASLSPYNPKPGYRGTAEVSVYVHPDWHGRGIGNALLSALVNTAAQRRFVTLVSLITADNEASLRLHARHGFVDVGTLRRVGYKLGHWVDVTFMQLIVEPASEEANP